jgi:hypothetical protein
LMNCAEAQYKGGSGSTGESATEASSLCPMHDGALGVKY